mmetsp:Transcript_1304/g.1875  ORF Transcript_1304/g.1875 Transcript_1304/m.1875 type:complete len:611 (+) Transcript_1304:47-1879(+)
MTTVTLTNTAVAVFLLAIVLYADSFIPKSSFLRISPGGHHRVDYVTTTPQSKNPSDDPDIGFCFHPDETLQEDAGSCNDRRIFVTGAVGAASFLLGSQSANAAISFPFRNPKSSSSLFIVSNKENTTATAVRDPSQLMDTVGEELKVEACLLELLPVKNKVFRTLERDIASASVIRMIDGDGKGSNDKLWDEIRYKLNSTLTYLDDQRRNIEPVFNQDDSTGLTLAKAERSERLIERLRNEILYIILGTMNRNATETTLAQKKALFSLAEVGELLIPSFPYDIPSQGKFSYLPRLTGRAKVTFTISRPTKRNGRFGNGGDLKPIGNVTILADGFAAPITAGNFVDLSMRGFYTGLTIKEMRKRLGVNPTLTMDDSDNLVTYDIASTIDKLTGEDSVLKSTIRKFGGPNQGTTGEEDLEKFDDGLGTVVTTIPVLGSFKEGFYDPLTAKPRRLPLEIVQYDRLTKTGKLSYLSNDLVTSSKGEVPLTKSASKMSESMGLKGLRNAILLKFDEIPGLVAMNHPDKNLNGASSEFFSLPLKDKVSEKTKLLDGTYAPFGYIIEGLDIMQSLKSGDVISATDVNEWGLLNLKKIRGSSFADAIKGEEEDDEETG